ncbi:MAG TPA: GGDEF domain-containing protein [Burkholderiaceae bacterium]|nr:GGDEF domain-containing protein [Burkholderiaceae bacterium]
MLGFDPRSFIIISAALGILCAFIFFVLHRSFPKDIRGLAPWGWACLTMTAAALLFALRGTVPLLFSSYLANVLLVSGIMMMYSSLRDFAAQLKPRVNLVIVLAGVALMLAWPTFIDDSYRLRVILISIVNSSLFAAAAVLIHRMRQKSFAEWFTQIVFLFTAAISFIRCAAALVQNAALDPITDVSVLQHVYLASFCFSIVALSLGFMLMVNCRLQMRLEYAASHDDLTGAYRRSAFFDMLDREIIQSCRHDRSISLLMVDLDNFKEINDRLGHLVGDRVIADYSQKAQRVLRSYDVIGRYGGEEFIVLLPRTSQEEAYAIAERLRDAAGPASSGDIPAYTVSIGIATSQGDNEHAANLIASADKALYAAKKAGKNRIEVAHMSAMHASAAAAG